ncbi:MAG: hypothetical protein JST89_00465 [Cyanobacteria bacterium SZAS-4]|nr:hypothetical protein [Cyanobacteria bacterium SZAS-4]
MHDSIERSDSSQDRNATDTRNTSNKMSREVGYGPSGDDMRRMRGNSTANDLPGLTIEDPGNSGDSGKGKHGPDQPSEADPQGTKSMGERLGNIAKAIQEHPELFKQLEEREREQQQPQETIGNSSGLASKDEPEHIGGKGHSRAI